MKPNEKLAASLTALKGIQDKGQRVFQSSQLRRADRERLLKHGFVAEIIKGWLMIRPPDASPGDTTPWFSAFWEFCRRYCEQRFGDDWSLGPHHSLDIHAEKAVLPSQVIIHSPKAGNNSLRLPGDPSMLLLEHRLAPDEDLEVLDGVRMLRIEPALVRATPSYYLESATEVRVALAGLRDVTELTRRLLRGERGDLAAAGRIAGALRRVGRPDLADEILRSMRSADYEVREVDPFEDGAPGASPGRRAPAPIVARLELLWQAARESVIANCPNSGAGSGKLAKTKAAKYLRRIDDLYVEDAYHSLSIEGYSVTRELIARVASGEWGPEANDEDSRRRNALAARGYYQAFQLVRDDVARALEDRNPSLVRNRHRDWYRELFAPSVAAGILRAQDLAGHRNIPVYLRGSRHTPPRWEVLREAMPALFDLIEAEENLFVRAVLGHWLFSYIHPFPDGNGRVARFLMNTLLAAGGYPWTVIRTEDRTQYMASLEAASVGGDLGPFAKFVAEQMAREPEINGARSRSE